MGYEMAELDLQVVLRLPAGIVAWQGTLHSSKSLSSALPLNLLCLAGPVMLLSSPVPPSKRMPAIHSASMCCGLN